MDLDHKIAHLWKKRMDRHAKEAYPIRKTMLAMELAQQTEKPKAKLPQPYVNFRNIFEKKTIEKLPLSRTFNHAIELNEGFFPKVAKVYPLNPKEQEACRAFIDEHLKFRKIIPSKSPQVSPFFFIPKKDGSVRPCQDYWYLNSHTVKNAYLLPLISNLIDKLKGSSIFTKMDIQWGYNNVLIKPEDRWKAVFVTTLGLFKLTVMFFDLCNSLVTFQVLMNHIFGDLIAKGWLIVYMDNILIHSNNQELHTKWMRKVLEWLWEHKLFLKLEKYFFNKAEVEYLGMIIKERHVRMDPVKLTTIQEWKPPSSVKGVRSFIGFCNFYWKFIPDFSTIAQPLHDLTKKGANGTGQQKCNTAFKTLWVTFTQGPVLTLSDTTKPFTVMTGVSLTATGVVLMQTDFNEDLHPCTFLSKTLSSAKCNYNIFDCKLLAVIQALTEWKHYLQGTGHPVTVVTNHKNLSYFK